MPENTLKGTSKRNLEVMDDFVNDYRRVRFGVIKQRKQRPAPTPRRRQKEISRLRRELRSLTHSWKKASSEEKLGLEKVRRQTRSKLVSLRRAETQPMNRKKRMQSSRSFFENPHRFTRKLFEQSRSGECNILQQELEDHLRVVYTDFYREAPMADIAGLVKPSKPGVMFDESEPKQAEEEKFVSEAREASAPGQNEIPQKSTRSVKSSRNSSGGN